jgi:antitoxin component YwqK of YwqJK toxin-antitoxin module
MKKVVVVFILLTISYFKAQVNTLESNLVLLNGLYYQNNAPFTGNALSYYPQEQIKSIYEIKEGQKTGRFTSYYYDKNFQKAIFKDTALIRTIENQILKTKNGITSIITDTVNSYRKMTSYLKEVIGGEKKLLKMGEKKNEGDLKGKKLNEYDEYKNLCFYHQLALNRLNEQELKLKTSKVELEKEIIKKEFFGISKEQYQQKNGIKDGAFISHFENGKLEKECNYLDGKLNGEYKSYYENGKLEKECNYLDGKLNGIYKSYYENGQLSVESNILNQEFDGKYTSWFENGKISSEGIFKEGKYNGFWTVYHENGNIKGKGIFQMADGTDIGSGEAALPDIGRNGEWKFFYENGNLEKEINYINGKLNGLFKSYFTNGKTNSEGVYKDNKYDGFWQFYFENGNKHGEGKYESGDGTDLGNSGIPKNGRNGEWKFFYENGKINEQASYFNGKLEGIRKKYFDDGKLELEINYKQGERNGMSRTFYPNGKLKQEANFLNDKCEGLCKTYFDTGKLSSEENIKQDERNGICKYYHSNGKLKSESNYKQGERNGISKEYFDSGVLEMLRNYDPASLHKNKIIGDAYDYNEDGTVKGHWFISKNGEVEDKLSKTNSNSSNTSSNSSEENKPYKCKCCKSTINGLKEGVNKYGSEYSNKYISADEKVFKLNNEMARTLGLPEPYSNVYEYLRESYKYCTMKCARTCYED